MTVSLTKKISTIIKLLFKPRVLKFLLSQGHSGYLIEKGWFNSYVRNSSVDENNQPIPWMTYSFIDFIENRLNNHMILFEFGSGNSTKYFSKKIRNIVAIEHNHHWYKKIKKELPDNATLLLSNTDEQYERSLFRDNTKYDIIVIDGIRRNECLIESIQALTSNGIIFLDDSERDDYKKGIDFLKNSGFKNLNFWGIAPGTFFNKCTTIFYREENCLGI